MTEQTPIEAINEFYRLKDKYETGYYEKYVKPIVRSNKSNKEKRVEYSRLPKHECINCKRNVGTLFSIKFISKEDIKQFKAKCGDIQDPCPLDIHIDYSVRSPMNKAIFNGLKEIEKIKLDIIKEKNNALFFNKDVVESFDMLTQELRDATENVGFIIETNILRNDNPEKKILIKQTIDEFGKGFILPFKQMIKEFDETNNEIILNQAITFYITEMIPKLKEIQLLKYDINMIEFDESTNIYKLIQLINSLENNEFFHKSYDKVIKFIRGVKKDKKKTRREEIEIKSKNKTRKLKPVSELVFEEEEEEIVAPEASIEDVGEDVGEGIEQSNQHLESKFVDNSIAIN